MYTAEFIVHLISYLLLRIAVNTILRLRLGDCYPKSPDRTCSHTHLETEVLVHDNLTTTSGEKKTLSREDNTCRRQDQTLIESYGLALNKLAISLCPLERLFQISCNPKSLFVFVNRFWLIRSDGGSATRDKSNKRIIDAAIHDLHRWCYIYPSR